MENVITETGTNLGLTSGVFRNKHCKQVTRGVAPRGRHNFAFLFLTDSCYS